MTPPSSRQKRRRSNLKHGLYTLRTAVQTLGRRALPSRSTALGRAFHEWRTALVADLGGPDAVSTQQRSLVALATTTKLMVDSIDAYVLTMGSLVDKRHRRLSAVVRERQALVAQLQSILRDLGLERRVKTLDLLAQLAALHSARPSPPAGRELSETGEVGSASSSVTHGETSETSE